jgi:hypothetical protein
MTREKKPLSKAREADAPLLARNNQHGFMPPILYYQASQIASDLREVANGVSPISNIGFDATV